MNPQSYIEDKPEILNCRVSLIQDQTDYFYVEIIGTIFAPAGCQSAVAEISVVDTTDGFNKIKPVYTFIENGQIDYSNVFAHTVNLGRLPCQVTTLSDWMSIAKIPAQSLALPFTGKRNLQFTVSILSQQTGTELACAISGITYENPSIGYIELEENITLAKTKAIPLAFAVAATEKGISAHAVDIIQNWIKNNVTVSQTSFTFNRLLAQLIAVLPGCTRLYSNRISRKIAATAPAKVRCDILELCLRVAGTDGIIAFEQLVLLKNIAYSFSIPREKFRNMIENILPIRMYEVDDMEISLGISADMDNNELCRQLSKEYRKWNARVTNRNPEIETQAEQMLKLIAELRDEYTE